MNLRFISSVMFLFVCVLLLFSTAEIVRADAPAWSVVPADYQYNSSVTCTVAIDSVLVTDSVSMIGAFCRDTVRGVASAIRISGKYLFFLTVYGNKISGDSLNFLLYDAQNDVVRSIKEKIHFSPDALIGDPITPYGFHCSSISEGNNVLFVYSSGWNMVSLPLTVTDNRKTALFPTAVSEAFSFLNGYQQNTAVQPSIGYWMKFPVDSILRKVSVTGTPRERDTVSVKAGWNMIGSVASSFASTSLVALGTTVESQCFAFNNGYQISETIQPGKGYWVKVSSDGKLVLQSAPASAPAKSLQIYRGRQ